MGFLDDAKDAAETAGRKIKEAYEDTADRIGDKVDEVKADHEVKKAEAAAKSVKGVMGVNMASLKVDPKGASTADQSSSAGEAASSTRGASSPANYAS